MNFVPLHVYSGYSFLRSGLSVAKIIKHAKDSGSEYACVCDFATFSMAPELNDLCKRNGLSPLFGMDLEIEGCLFSLFVLNEEGYSNLLSLSFLSQKGLLNLEELRNSSKGLAIVLDASTSPIREMKEEEYPSYFVSLTKGLERFYLGIPYLPNEGEFIASLRKFVSVYPYEALAFPFIAYETEKDAITLEILKAISSDSTLSEKEKRGDAYFLSEETLSAYYSQQELFATLSLAQSSSFSFVKKRGGLLKFPCPEGYSSFDYLSLLAKQGLEKKRPSHDEIYDKRLEYELSIINKMGYADYFLLVQDYVSFAKRNGIPVGPGRGSGAGSLVSFALDIVTPDPIENSLLFERFLNPERSSMPDIDVDFSDIKRDMVVTYLKEKYGEDHVAHIVTMQTLGAKASLRDIGRVFEYEPRQIDLICKTITDPRLTLRQNYKKNPQFRRLIDSDPFFLEIVTLAVKIEGFPRQSGLHAAGIVLNDAPLEKAIPVKIDENIGYVVQYEMGYLEEQGFLKMDLLGLRNLTIIDTCLNLISASTGISLPYEGLPFDDKSSIALIAEGKTMGLFQLESAGMNKAIREVKPESFDDIVALLALFRPGPMASIPSYAKRKAGKEPVTYLIKELEPILSSTYGIIVYQEQVMQIAQAVAGFSLGEADILRRAISKKDAGKLDSLKGAFIAGCLKNGHPRNTAERLYDLIYRFADYGFNKSHAVSYATIACQMAYLKKNYPAAFYCAVLDGTSSSDPKFAALISEMKKSGTRLLVPDINKAFSSFVPEKEGIRFPLSSLKGIQGNLIKMIIAERSNRGPYLDFFDFAARTRRFGLNQGTLVKMIDAGCFDCFGINRPSLRATSSQALNYAEMMGVGEMENELIKFDFPKPSIVRLEDDIMGDLYAEREVLGLMISGSPLKQKESEIRQKGLVSLEEASSYQSCKVAAILSSVKVIKTKKGTRMAFLTLYDDISVAEAVLFSEEYDKAYPLLKEGNMLELTLNKENGREGYLARDIALL